MPSEISITCKTKICLKFMVDDAEKNYPPNPNLLKEYNNM